MEREYYVYIMASKRNGALYVGVTGDLVYRVRQRKQNVVKCFTQRYGVHNLVYYETHSYVYDAILREKRIKESLIKSDFPSARGLRRKNQQW